VGSNALKTSAPLESKRRDMIPALKHANLRTSCATRRGVVAGTVRDGTRLGHYNVTAVIGEGVIGQVWQATNST
jgi:hypothetical protein